MAIRKIVKIGDDCSRVQGSALLGFKGRSPLVSPIYGRSIVIYGDSEDCEDWR